MPRMPHEHAPNSLRTMPYAGQHRGQHGSTLVLGHNEWCPHHKLSHLPPTTKRRNERPTRKPIICLDQRLVQNHGVKRGNVFLILFLRYGGCRDVGNRNTAEQCLCPREGPSVPARSPVHGKRSTPSPHRKPPRRAWRERSGDKDEGEP